MEGHKWMSIQPIYLTCLSFYITAYNVYTTNQHLHTVEEEEILFNTSRLCVEGQYVSSQVTLRQQNNTIVAYTAYNNTYQTLQAVERNQDERYL
jgi:hypothetical protein